jgi:CRP/FNR family transcriptional regulator, cyclic AMP receptor protein
MFHSRLQLLLSMPIFSGLENETVEHLLKGARIRDVGRGEVVFREGELDTSLYVIEHGRVSVHRLWKENQYKLRELSSGDCFGEMALMDYLPRSATVIADVDCSLIQISAAQLGEFYAINPQQYTLIYINLGKEVSRRLRESDKRLFMYEMEKESLS